MPLTLSASQLLKMDENTAIINAVQGSFLKSTALVNLEVAPGYGLYGFLLDAKRSSQRTITQHRPEFNPSYATFSDDTQQVLSIDLGAIPEEICFIKAYIGDNQRSSQNQHTPGLMQLYYRGHEMEVKKKLPEIYVGDVESHALTLLRKPDNTWHFGFGDCEDFDKYFWDKEPDVL